MSSPLAYPTPAVPPATGIVLANAPAGMGVPASGLSPFNYWAQLGGLVFNCVDQAGVEWFFSDPDGWADGTSVALTQQQRGAAHGAWMGTTWLEARNIVFAGRVRAPTPVLAWQARNVLLGVIASMSALGVMNLDTTLSINEPDALKSAGVRPSDKPSIAPQDKDIFTFSIPLTAGDPRKYGTAQALSAGLPVASSGLTFPVGPFGVTFGGTGTSGLISVSNLGNFPTRPTLTIVGPCTNPFVSNTTTGETLPLNIVLGASDTLVVDCDISSVILNGTADRSNAVNPGGVFPTVVPGLNVFQFGASSYSSAAQLTVSWSSVWW